MLAEVLRVRVRRARHDDNIHIRIERPDLLGRLDAADPRRQIQLENHRRKWLLPLKRVPHRFHCCVALVARVDLETRIVLDIRLLTQKHLLEAGERIGRIVRLEVLTQARHILGNLACVVVDNQYAIGRCMQGFGHGKCDLTIRRIVYGP